MTTEFTLLLGTAAALGFVHTLLGPDHYVPFIAMARARRWSERKAMTVTLLSGIGHVTSSIAIGAIGLLIGAKVLKLTKLESFRGQIAGWLLLGFGLAYMVWGLRHGLRRSRITHHHEAVVHTHITHNHPGHDHGGKVNLTPWVLFTIFVFGPCEPLIPLLMYPAARADAFSVVAVAAVFGVVTIGTMSVIVFGALRGMARIEFRGLEHYSHALAGLVIALCGAGMQFLGL